MEFLVAGATAVQIGTANFYNPGLSAQLVNDLTNIVQEQGLSSITELVGTLTIPQR